MLKKIVTIGTIVALFFSLQVFHLDRTEAKTITLKADIYVDDTPIKTDYFLKEGHLFVPALFFKNAGTFVDWNSQYNAVIFRHKEKMLSFPIDKKNFYEYVQGKNIWQAHPLTEVTVEMNGTPYVPLAVVARELGMDVAYDTTTKTTYITSNSHVEQNQILHGKRKWKLVALTFDDGPEDFYSPQILDILKEKKAPATFFMMGKNVAKYPNQVKRIIKEGHAIGNHSYNHPDFRKTWTKDVIDEIQSTQYEFLNVIGRKPDIIRPPYGATTKADIAIFNKLGLRNILWSVDTLDWQGKTKEEVLEIVEEQIFPGGIILLHNFGGTGGELEGAIEALPEIIDGLREKGYKFVTIQTMLDIEKWNDGE